MNNLRLLDRYRMTGPDVIAHWGWAGDETCGMFALPSPIDQKPLLVVASGELGWEHVSVSRVTRCPNWLEMDFIKNQFFGPEETVMQLHPPRSQWVSDHPYCLHLWRPTDQQIPLPPKWMVGGTSKEEATKAARDLAKAREGKAA